MKTGTYQLETESGTRQERQSRQQRAGQNLRPPQTDRRPRQTQAGGRAGIPRRRQGRAELQIDSWVLGGLGGEQGAEVTSLRTQELHLDQCQSHLRSSKTFQGSLGSPGLGKNSREPPLNCTQIQISLKFLTPLWEQETGVQVQGKPMTELS